MYKLKNDTFVPVFTQPSIEFYYEIGFRGNCCDAMDTVLLPGFYVRIDQIFKNGAVRVTATRDHSYLIRGYIHKKLIERAMIPCAGVDFNSLNDPPKIPKISDVISAIDKLLNDRIEYCFGGNVPFEVNLDGLYKFRQIAGNHGASRKFSCKGFDSSGLIHYLSNGYLPHNIYDILSFGERVYSLNPNHPLAQLKIEEIAENLKDTDLIVVVPETRDDSCLGKVMIACKFGLVEIKGQNLGIIKTHPYETRAKIAKMLQRAKLIGGNLYVIRWHPEVLFKKP
jgi:hypothetical protein